MSYLHDSFKHSGFKHLNILSSSGIMVAKLQNGQKTRSGIPACFISSSCNRLSNIENILVGNMFCSTDTGNSSLHVSNKHGNLVLLSPITTSQDRLIHSLQNKWPSAHVDISSNIHSSSKQQPHSKSSPFSLASFLFNCISLSFSSNSSKH